MIRDPISITELLRDARARLAKASFAPSMREAGLLLRSVLGWTESQLLTHDQAIVEPEPAERFETLLQRRLTGEPMAYVLGEREFWGRMFAVDHRVLIPRPETEHLVEAVLALNLPPSPRILDIGTGSGCIAMTLALEKPTARVVATDRSFDALRVAASNARRLGCADRVRLVQADLTTALKLNRFDLVVSNPPYIDPAERQNLSLEVVDFEPSAALFAAERGRAIVDRLIRNARMLNPGTPMVLEIGYDQAALIEVAETSEVFAHVDLIRDYAGHPRTAVLIRGPRSTCSVC